VRGIFLLLHNACPAGHEVFFAPLDWQPDRRTSLQPDVLVVAVDHIGPRTLTGSLALAVEVLSASTRRKDQVLKRSKYEDAGVPCYWIIDPVGPSITMWSMRDGHYADMTAASGDDIVESAQPFPVRVQPSALSG
jgi:Uma2 family endonuclease